MSSTDCQVQGSRFLTQRSHNIIYCKSNESAICPTKAATKLCGEPGSQAAPVSFDEAFDMAIIAIQTNGPVLIQMVEGGTFGTPGKNYPWYGGISIKGLGPSFCTLYGNLISPGLMAMRDPSYKVMLKSGCSCIDGSQDCACNNKIAEAFNLSEGEVMVGTSTGGTSSFSALDASTGNSQVTFIPGEGEKLILDGVIFNTSAGQTAITVMKEGAGAASLEAANVKVNGKSDGQTPLYQVVNMGTGTFQEKFNSVAFAFPDGSTDVSGSTNAALSYTLMGTSKTERNHTGRTITTDSATSVQKVVMEEAKVDSTLTDITNTTKTGTVDDTIVTDTASLKETSTNATSEQLSPTTNSLNIKVVSGQAQVDSTQTGNTDIGQVSDGIMNTLEASGAAVVKETKSNNNFTNTGSGASTAGYLVSENANLSVKATNNTVEAYQAAPAGAAYKAEGCVDVSGGRNIVSYLYNDGGTVKFSSTGSTYLTDCGQNKNWTQKAGQLNESWANHTSSNSELIDVASREVMLEGGQHSLTSTNSELDQQSTVAAYLLTAAADAVSKTNVMNSTLSNEGGPVLDYTTLDEAKASVSLTEPTLTSTPIPKPKAGYYALPDISGNSTICPAINTMSMNDSTFKFNATGTIVNACQLAAHVAMNQANTDITHDVAENDIESADISQAPFIGVLDTGTGNGTATVGGTIQLPASATPVAPGLRDATCTSGAYCYDAVSSGPSSIPSSREFTMTGSKKFNVSNLDLTILPSTDVSGGIPFGAININVKNQPNVTINLANNKLNLLGSSEGTGVLQQIENCKYKATQTGNEINVLNGTAVDRKVMGTSQGSYKSSDNQYAHLAPTDMPLRNMTYEDSPVETGSYSGNTLVGMSNMAADVLSVSGKATVGKQQANANLTNFSENGATTVMKNISDQATVQHLESGSILSAFNMTPESLPPTATLTNISGTAVHSHISGSKMTLSDGRGEEHNVSDEATHTWVPVGQMSANTAPTAAPFVNSNVSGNATMNHLPMGHVEKFFNTNECKRINTTDTSTYTQNMVGRIASVNSLGSPDSTYEMMSASGDSSLSHFKNNQVIDTDGNNTMIHATDNSKVLKVDNGNNESCGGTSTTLRAEGGTNVSAFQIGQLSQTAKILDSITESDASGNSPTISVNSVASSYTDSDPASSFYKVRSNGNGSESYLHNVTNTISMTPDGQPPSSEPVYDIQSAPGTAPANLDLTNMTVTGNSMGSLVRMGNTNGNHVNISMFGMNGPGYEIDESAVQVVSGNMVTPNDMSFKTSNGSILATGTCATFGQGFAQDDGSLLGNLVMNTLTSTNIGMALTENVANISLSANNSLNGNIDSTANQRLKATLPTKV